MAKVYKGSFPFLAYRKRGGHSVLHLVFHTSRQPLLLNSRAHQRNLGKNIFAIRKFLYIKYVESKSKSDFNKIYWIWRWGFEICHRFLLFLLSLYPKTHFPEPNVILRLNPDSPPRSFKWFRSRSNLIDSMRALALLRRNKIWGKHYKTSIKMAKKKGPQQQVVNFKVSRRSTYFLYSASFFTNMATLNITGDPF